MTQRSELERDDDAVDHVGSGCECLQSATVCALHTSCGREVLCGRAPPMNTLSTGFLRRQRKRLRTLARGRSSLRIPLRHHCRKDDHGGSSLLGARIFAAVGLAQTIHQVSVSFSCPVVSYIYKRKREKKTLECVE